MLSREQLRDWELCEFDGLPERRGLGELTLFPTTWPSISLRMAFAWSNFAWLSSHRGDSFNLGMNRRKSIPIEPQMNTIR
jgi:hypothetical protein